MIEEAGHGRCHPQIKRWAAVGRATTAKKPDKTTEQKVTEGGKGRKRTWEENLKEEKHHLRKLPTGRTRVVLRFWAQGNSRLLLRSLLD